MPTGIAPNDETPSRVRPPKKNYTRVSCFRGRQFVLAFQKLLAIRGLRQLLRSSCALAASLGYEVVVASLQLAHRSHCQGAPEWACRVIQRPSAREIVFVLHPKIDVQITLLTFLRV